MADFKWALDVFLNSVFAFIAIIATTTLIALTNSSRIAFILIAIAYCLVLGFALFKLKNWRIAIGLLLSVIYAVIFYYEVIDGID